MIARDLVDELVAGNGDRIDRSLVGLYCSPMRPKRMRPLVGMIVSLQYESHVMLVEYRHPIAPQNWRLAPTVGGIDRVVKHDDLPTRLGSRECHVKPFRLSSRGTLIGYRKRAIENGETRVSRLKRVDQLRSESGRSIPRKLEERAIQPRTRIQILMIASARHQRDMVEYSRRPQKKVVPVGAIVPTVD